MAKAQASTVESTGKKATRRQIPGNLPYTRAPGKLSDALKNIIDAERPQKFNRSFLEGVLKITGGSAAPIPPILKKVGFLSSDNSPTDLYSKFKSDSSRAEAALGGLKLGFEEIFRRNEYAHKLSDDKIKDIIVEITGLSKGDSIVSAILGTFSAFNEYAKEYSTENVSKSPVEKSVEQPLEKKGRGGTDFQLVNNISIVLPETTDIEVYNAIFKSLRENIIT